MRQRKFSGEFKPKRISCCGSKGAHGKARPRFVGEIVSGRLGRVYDPLVQQCSGAIMRLCRPESRCCSYCSEVD
jgi:hypothetical protein